MGGTECGLVPTHDTPLPAQYMYILLYVHLRPVGSPTQKMQPNFKWLSDFKWLIDENIPTGLL